MSPLRAPDLKLACHFNDKLHVNSYVKAGALTQIRSASRLISPTL